jgi:hypothetical protein
VPPYDESMDDDTEPTEEEWAAMTFEELIERSSFGTPEAVAARKSAPREIIDELVAGLRAYYRDNP